MQNTIIDKFEKVFGQEIENNFSHENLEEAIKDNSFAAKTMPQYKIRICDHRFIMRGDRHWLCMFFCLQRQRG